jgi:uncharacterized protein YhaN
MLAEHEVVVSILKNWTRPYPCNALERQHEHERLDALRAEENRLLIQQSSIRHQIEAAQKGTPLDDLDSAIKFETERLSQLDRQRSLNLVAMAILEYADVHYRKRNHPELLQRASIYMRTMTEGRYQNLFMSQNGIIQLERQGEILPLTETFSRGTIHQLFLAFRMAMIDLLDPDGTLPVIFDEAFVNWDFHRLEATCTLLKQWGNSRQVIATTCHMPLVEIFKNKHANIVPLVENGGAQ